MQVAYTRDVARAFRGTAPSLGLVARAFGSYTRDNWLDVQLTDLAVFSGCKDKLSERQVQQLIDIIAEEYGYMKVTELMYFFRRFKTGEYGKFYGAVDPITITCALKEFARERLDILRRLEHAEKERRQKSDPGHQRYVRRYEAYRRMCRFYSLNFRSPDFTLGELDFDTLAHSRQGGHQADKAAVQYPHIHHRQRMDTCCVATGQGQRAV